MGQVILDLAITLDGFIATTDGQDGGLHRYFFSPSTETARVIQAGIAATGAIVMGRRTYDLGAAHDGFADSPYSAALLVLTHQPPATRARGAEDFTFVTDGIHRALALAQTAAGERDVVIGGGAETARQFLRAALIDTVQLHVVPIAFGRGMRLFDEPMPRLTLLESHSVLAPDAVHLAYRIQR
jgi:dihydrofolate reductase